MNLVNKEYHKRAKVLLANWQDSRGVSTPFEWSPDKALATIIELNLLTADASISEVNKLCKFAQEYGVAGIVVNPVHVERCVEVLGGTVPVGTVVGFPLGANHSKIKVAETELAVEQGARNISMVINSGLLKTSNFQEVFEEMRAVRYACPEADLTIILEVALLEPLQVIIACMLCREAGADAVKASTAFAGPGAPPENVSLMRFVLGDDLDIVASGSSMDREGMVSLLKVGATRLTVGFLATDDTLHDLIKRFD